MWGLKHGTGHRNRRETSAFEWRWETKGPERGEMSGDPDFPESAMGRRGGKNVHFCPVFQKVIPELSGGMRALENSQVTDRGWLA